MLDAGTPARTPRWEARLDVDRLRGLARRSAGARTRIEHLSELCLRGLEKMYVGGGMFVQTLRGVGTKSGPQLRAEGDSLRYAAIVALGLSRVPEDRQRQVLKGLTAVELAFICSNRAIHSGDAGAVALAAWAAAEVGHAYPSDLFDLLTILLAADRPVETVPCAWVLTAALAARRFGDTEELTASAAGRLLAGQARSGLFPHVLPAEARGRIRAHVGSFADQVYPIQALARLSAAVEEYHPLQAAEACATKICASQGVAGQWWWHYDNRDGGVVEGYPVYSVHQHAMAPMVLLDLWEAGGKDHWWPVIRGFTWIDSHPESPATLVSDRDALIWRKIGRREPRKAARSISALTTSLRSGWHLPGLDVIFPPGGVDYECRPYELGWLLYAWHSSGVVQALRHRGTAADA